MSLEIEVTEVIRLSWLLNMEALRMYRILDGGTSLIRPASVCGWLTFTLHSFILQCELKTVMYNRLGRTVLSITMTVDE